MSKRDDLDGWTNFAAPTSKEQRHEIEIACSERYLFVVEHSKRTGWTPELCVLHDGEEVNADGLAALVGKRIVSAEFDDDGLVIEVIDVDAG